MKETSESIEQATVAEILKPVRRRLSDTRAARVHKFKIGNVSGYLNVGFFDDGRPGELFVTVSKAGSVVRGLLNQWAISVSTNLQYGVPVEVIAKKFAYARFEPNGWCVDDRIKKATSLTDYVARWIGYEYVEGFAKWCEEEEKK